jgi:hypothetical protein
MEIGTFQQIFYGIIIASVIIYIISWKIESYFCRNDPRQGNSSNVKNGAVTLTSGKPSTTKREKVRKFGELTHVIFILAIGLAIVMNVTIIYEYIPSNHIEEIWNLEDMSIKLEWNSPLIVPLKNVIIPLSTNLIATVFTNDSIDIKSVSLSTPENSLLSFNGPFKDFEDDSTEGKKYKTQLFVHHDGNIINYTAPYKLNIYYTITDNNSGSNSTSNNTIDKTPIISNKTKEFYWKVQTNEIPVLGYLWIVIIGVVTSRLLSLVLKSENKNIQSVGKDEGIWIIFSFIIAVLIFSSFSKEVTLTKSILMNVSLAFGFGFAFERILTLSREFTPLISKDK